MFKNKQFGRFQISKNAQPSSDKPEVALNSKESHNEWQNYINIIGTCSVVNYTKFYQNINNRSWDNVKESVKNNDFDVTLSSERRCFWTHIGNYARNHAF